MTRHDENGISAVSSPKTAGSFSIVIDRFRLHVVAAFALTVWSLFVSGHVPLTRAWAPVIAYALLILAWSVSNRYFDYEEDAVSQGPDAAGSPALLFVALTAAGFGAALLAFVRAPLLPYLALVPLMLLYSWPVRLFGRRRRLKQVLIIKNVYAAFVWHLTYAFVFFFYTTLSAGNFVSVYLQTIDIFFIIFAIEVLWDIRDVEGDRAVGTRTIPNTFPLYVSKVVIGVFLGAAGAVWALHSFFSPSLFLFLLFFFCTALFASPSRSSAFFRMPIYAVIACMVWRILAG